MAVRLSETSRSQQCITEKQRNKGGMESSWGEEGGEWRQQVALGEECGQGKARWQRQQASLSSSDPSS